ncbi:MAG: hypothetical protein DRR19_09300 [Candidatus Parabeggiatoa sp. nov. 1]|nr:MAG: hypothetical protein DRR19_09300 [Gammaproteobacteria bacterium]
MRQFVTFYLGGDRYAIDILLSKEIGKIHDLTPVPEAPTYIVGLMNLRGQILTVVNLQCFLEQNSETMFEEKKLIILKTESELKNRRILTDVESMVKDPLAIIVDKMGDILNVEPEEILPPPSHLTGAKREFVSGVIQLEHQLIIVLEINQLVRRCLQVETTVK